MIQAIKLIFISFFLFSSIMIINAKNEESVKIEYSEKSDKVEYSEKSDKKDDIKKSSKKKDKKSSKKKSKKSSKKKDSNKSGNQEEKLSEQQENNDPIKALWKDSKVIDKPSYIVEVPTTWEKFPNMSKGVELNFNFAGYGIPSQANGGAVLASFYISKENASSIESAVNLVSKSRLRMGAQEIKNRKIEKENINGILLESEIKQFLNGRDAKRYDLVTFSEKNASSHVFSIIIQVKNINKFMLDNPQLEKLVEELFSHITIKN